MKKELKVTFQPYGRSVYVLAGTTLLESAARAGFIIQTPCGGTGKCGKCIVRITKGQCSVCTVEKSVLSEEQIFKGYRLACQCKVEDNLVIEVPEKSLFQGTQQILSGSHEWGGEVRPAVIRKTVKVEPPSRKDVFSDVESLLLSIGEFEIDLVALRKLPLALREGDYTVTVTIVENTIIDIQPGNGPDKCCGVAFDIGTTTVVGTLIDMTNGIDMAVSSAINPQTSFGDDVVSRIKRCRDKSDGLTVLQSEIIETVNRICVDLAQQALIKVDSIYEAVFAGNTTMQQILCRIDPGSLGEMPFSPVFRQGLQATAAELGLEINQAAKVHVMPQIGGFLGGDTVAGILACRLNESQKPALLIDVGTNGEIVLSNEGKMVATSVAAGPAFEGARIEQGMRATAGAIEKVVFNDDVAINVIGNAKPCGICGTGLVDAVAELLRSGILESTGRIRAADELSEGVPAAIRQRVIEIKDEPAFVLVGRDESSTGEIIYLCQKDIRELQLANGAIRAGINLLLKKEGLTPADLGSALIAGAFGNFIRRSNARRIGMLPDIEIGKTKFVGNTASFGAKRYLLSLSEREYARRILETTTHLDLSLNPEFQTEFAESMIFPEE